MARLRLGAGAALAAGCLAIAAALAVAPGGASLRSARAEDPAPKYYEVGDIVQDFELTGLDGSKTRLYDQKGKPILLNFWASW
ncbi:MAG: redoxin domain-containing protein [Planctomycetes bacterium]|nr:redoxin domain-containing protein [Planctomycetota bacterium]